MVWALWSTTASSSVPTLRYRTIRRAIRFCWVCAEPDLNLLQPFPCPPGINPILQATFTFAQMYFIFTYSRLMINKFKLIARLGLMHLVATNICVWIRTLGKETLHVCNPLATATDINHLTPTQELKTGSSGNAFLEELILPLRNQITKSKSMSRSIGDDFNNHSEESLLNATGAPAIDKSNPCGKEDIMGTILSDASPYLYPFSVEYSLIGAAFLYVMWSTIGKGKHNQLCNYNENQSTVQTSSPNNQGLQVDNLSTCSSNTYTSNYPAFYSCLGSSRGDHS